MKQNRTCFILRGYPASGKSTVAKKLSEINSAIICSADDYWMQNGKYEFVLEKLHEAHNACFTLFKNSVISGSNVIVDNTNIKYTDICRYIDFLLINNNQNEFIYSVEFIQIAFNDIEKAISYRTNNSIGKNIPEKTMRRMYTEFKKEVKGHILNDYKGKIGLGKLDELISTLPFSLNTENKPEVIICDLDGTLSLFQYTNGIMLRDAYDAAKSNQDFINVPVAQALKAFQQLGHEIIFLSGREDKFRIPTEEFLQRVCDEYDVVYDKLFMRQTGDNRPDDIIKKEIFDKEIKDKYFVTAIFDDRPKVVRMWRSIGLFVFDCNYRGIEF